MQNEIYDVIDKLEDTKIIKRIRELKKEILSSEEALTLINKFYDAKELYEKYNDKQSFLANKKELMNNELLKEYLTLQNEINMLIIHINNRINEITSIGGKNESNKW